MADNGALFICLICASLARPPGKSLIVKRIRGGGKGTGGLPDTAGDRSSPLVTFYQDIRQTTDASTSFLGKHSFFSFARILSLLFPGIIGLSITNSRLSEYEDKTGTKKNHDYPGEK